MLEPPPNLPRSTGSNLVTQLRAAGDPLHLMAAKALVNLGVIAERLQERVYQLEAIARLNGETIPNMQRAAAEAASALYRASPANGGRCTDSAPVQP